MKYRSATAVKLVTNDFQKESRDEREIGVLKELGFQVIVVARGDRNRRERKEGYEIHRRTTRPIGKSGHLVAINRISSIFLWAFYIKSLKPRCISCHDLAALSIGWISTWFIPIKRRPKLVYDSHEYEAGRNIERSPFSRRLVISLERFLIKKSVFTIVVNESIANELRKLHHGDGKIFVVRNIPPYGRVDERRCEEKRRSIFSALNVPEGSFAVMYHGAIVKNRGIENMMEALSLTQGVVAIILGYGDPAYVDQLKQFALNMGVDKRILFVPAVGEKELLEFVGAADLGVVLIKNSCLSYYLSLPNKIFENIQAEVPMIGSDFPEIKKIIEGFQIGLVCDSESIGSIADAINIVKTNKELYVSYKNSIKNAKQELCWEKEKGRLINAYTENIVD